MKQQIDIKEFVSQISLFQKEKEVTKNMKYYFSDVLTQEWTTKDLELRRLIRLARYSCRIQKIDALKKHISEIKRYLKQKESL